MKAVFDKFKQAWPLFLAGLILGGASAVLVTHKLMLKKQKELIDQIRPIRVANSHYQFISPLLTYFIPNGGEFGAFAPLEKKVSYFINNQKASGKVSDVSVYFRDLNLGRWMGINQNREYDPASMLKVIIMIAYYKQAENNPSILSEKITYTKDLNTALDAVPFQTPSSLQTGQKYSIEDLIRSMITNSDNGAKNALLANINQDSLNEVYSDLRVQVPDDQKPYTISARAYSFFFRILYNSTYLSEAYSEKALGLLTQTEYKEGLTAGLPEGLKTAHKFGEHVNPQTGGQIMDLELHDCGIVYNPDRPYALCVMTKGKNLNNLANTIKTISTLIFESVDSNYKK